MVRSIARWRTLAGVALVVACALPSPANQSPRTTVGSVTDSAADSAAVSATLDRFLRAFERLDWQTFRRAFADDATVFFPSAATPARHVGRAAYEARFQQEFSEIRAGGASGPPYMELRPVGLQIRVPGPGVAVVTFELKNERRHGRRSIIFRRTGTEWLIAHLHASNVPWPDEPGR